MTAGSIEKLVTGAENTTTYQDTALVEKGVSLPIRAHELRYPRNVMATLLFSRLLIAADPMPAEPSYTVSKKCLADTAEQAKRSHSKPENVFTGVPKHCNFKGCGAVCVPSVAMGGAVQLGEIPRTSCKNTLVYSAEVSAYDDAIAAYSERHPQREEAFETDLVSPVAGQLATEASLADDLGLPVDVVHEFADI